MAIELPPTGNETVDLIRGLQITVDNLDRTEEKMGRLKLGLAAIEAKDLLERPFLVRSFSAFAISAEIGQESRLFFGEGITFIGQLSAYSYMFDRGIPVDSLIMKFEKPQAFVDEEDEERFNSLLLEVPVLSIDSCLRLDDAA